MGQTDILTKEAFEQDEVLKEEFGSYENYLTSFQQGGASVSGVEGGQKTGDTPPTLDEYVKVENGESLETKPKSAYDMYMEEAKSIYNQGVETNNKKAANQAASAGAQYREVIRNVDELNKANGRANTGYAGDTSIDAYNAYRNSVNESYANADKANNDLYSYYLSEMTKIQQAKDNKEASDRQLEQTDKQLEQADRELDMLEEQNEFNKIYGETGFKKQIENYLTEDDFYPDGTIKAEAAEKWWNFAVSYFGGVENIPSLALGELESIDGFEEWLIEYNRQTNNGNQSGATSEYVARHNVAIPYSLQKIDNSGKISEDGTTDFAVLKTTKTIDSSKIKDKNLNNFRIEYDGEVYYLETGKGKTKPGAEAVSLMNEQIEKTTGRAPTEGDCCYYGGNIYIVCEDGDYRRVEAREADNNKEYYNKFVSAIKKNLGISEND